MRFYIFIFIAITFQNCITGHLITTPNGYSITKDGNFKLKDRFQLPDSAGIDTSKVYLQSCYGSLLKFYKNGRVAWGVFLDEPHAMYLAGYYKLENNKLTIEMSDGGTGYDWARLVIKGILAGDTLKFFKDQWGGTGANIGHFTNLKDVKTNKDCFYIKSSKEYALKQADW